MNEADRELLECLQEECAEVIQAVSKALRHGLDSYHPDNPAMDNHESINREIGHVIAMCHFLQDRSIYDVDMTDHYLQQKKQSLGQYLHHSDIVDGKVRPRKKDG